MLKQYPMLRYVLQKGFWYLLTFVFAVALNFALPRLGDNNPVDIIMGQAEPRRRKPNSWCPSVWPNSTIRAT